MRITIQCLRPGRWELRESDVHVGYYNDRASAIAGATRLRAGSRGATVTILTRTGVVSYEWRYGTHRTSSEPRAARRRTARRTSAAGRRFGVELEFSSAPQGVDHLARELTRRGVACQVEGYNHRTRSHWKIVTDSSCGYELVSPPLSGAEGLAQVALVGDVMRELNVNVTQSCGVHVHVETRELTVDVGRRVLRSYANAQSAIDSLLAASRRSARRNQWCSPLSEHDLAQADRASDVSVLANTSRYRVVNLTAFPRQGTVEFRQHHGTRRGQAVADWAALCVAMIELAVAGGTLPAACGLGALIALATDRGMPADAALRLASRPTVNAEEVSAATA